MGLRARVQRGRVVIDEPTELPEGMVLDLVLDDEGDELTEADRRALESSISRSLSEAASGTSAPAEDILARLRARRVG